MKKGKKKVVLVLGSILGLALLYGVLFIFNFFQGWTTVKDGKISSYVTPLKNKFKSSYEPKLNFKDQKITEINDVSVKLYGEEFSLKNSIVLKAQRYYISIDDICSLFSYSISSSDQLTLSGKKVISLDSTIAKIDSKDYILRGTLLENNNKYYLGLSDIEFIFDVIIDYNFDDKIINFVDKTPISVDKVDESVEKKVALIRLEDFSAGDAFYSSKNILKFKAMGDLLYKNNMKFHIAWVPRFKAPSENIDNDLLVNNTMQNVAFINILDYFINSGALVGAHGYTHQANDERSLNGTELSSKANSSEEETRLVIESAIDTASALNIPIAFFESPHYQATSSQKKIIEEYFQYIYEPKNFIIYHTLKSTSKGNLYIPTPLSYVKDLNPEPIVKNLINPRYGLLGSVFYHPTLDLDFIEASAEGNTFTVQYDSNSPLSKIINAIKEGNHETVHVTQFK
ncbi:MAG: DUF2334 domain-containing protein [Clostridium sp.]